MSIINGISGSFSSDPTSQSAQSAESLEEDLNNFLTLLTTQLQYQDPLDPMDSTEFTSQLVQFASVEQQIYQNSNLESLLEVERNNQLSTLTNFINSSVEVEGQGLPLENSYGKFTYNLPIGSQDATITITDSSGLQVFTTPAEQDPGLHVFEWNGLGNAGQQVADGAYRVQVNAFDAQGNVVDGIVHTVFGRVTGAGIVNGETTLFMGSTRAPLDSILSVEETETTTEQTTQ